MSAKNYYLFCFSFLFLSFSVQSQNPLFIPDTLAGPIYNLTVQDSSKIFFPPNVTPTYGMNGDLLAPVLIMNKGDSITLNVTNNLNASTTMHWHGFHVSPQNDGGPHQVILPSTTWSPSFKVRNDAATYWFHPHLHENTERQVTKGLAGLIIIRDSIESTYNLPRRYGVDDFPMIVQSKAFDAFFQLASFTSYDSIIMINGTIDPFLSVPAQVVRIRLLAASSERTFLFGLEGNKTFYQIATDGGLLDQPVSLTRLRLSTGERAEILIDLTGMQGQSLFLKSFASELPIGIIGSNQVGIDDTLHGYYSNPLNGNDYNLLRFDVVAPTANPVTNIPVSFAPLSPWNEASADVSRDMIFSLDTITLLFSPVEGPFLINNQPFHMDSMNVVSYLNDIEVWRLINTTEVAHPFHIHDIQFYILDINGSPPPQGQHGQKDVVLVQPGDTVRFITQFETFADNNTPYMYHCHILHHEDEGMMGHFLVVDTLAVALKDLDPIQNIFLSPNPTSDFLYIETESLNNKEEISLLLYNVLGQKLHPEIVWRDDRRIKINISNFESGFYSLIINSENALYQGKVLKL